LRIPGVDLTGFEYLAVIENRARPPGRSRSSLFGIVEREKFRYLSAWWPL
jgi:hypothetical protein